MRTRLLALALVTAVVPLAATATPAAAQSRQDEARWREAQRRFDSERARYEAERDRYESLRGRRGGYGSGYNNRGYDSANGEDRYRWRGGERDWDGSRYYREDSRYEERRLSADDEVYRGSDGRYYCRRSDGTTGLVIGAGVGALAGRVVDTRGDRTPGTLIGGVLGALIGRQVERSQDLRCR